jgi:tRNA(fMet)-specific endonuclease VapC
MSLHVLDTDILSLLQAGHATVLKNVAARPQKDIAISVVSVEEQLSGWYTLLRQAKQNDKVAFAYLQLARSVRSLSTLTILDYDLPCIHRYDSLRKQKLNVRKMDLRIAAIVLEQNATLVTRNAQDFKQVPGLTFVDWSQ